MDLRCKICGSSYGSYFAIDRDNALEQEGCQWSQDIDIEDEWVCGCGKTTFSLKYLKSGLSGYLGRPRASFPNLEFEPLYNLTRLQQTRKAFLDILNRERDEKPLQRFIENNPILLSSFDAQKIQRLPKVGTRYEGDFAILDVKNDLILIEIEKPSIRLVKQNGHRTAALNARI